MTTPRIPVTPRTATTTAPMPTTTPPMATPTARTPDLSPALSALGRCVGEEQRFLADAFTRSPHRFSGGGFDDLLSLADVDDQLSGAGLRRPRSEEHTSELQSLMRNSYAAFC